MNWKERKSAECRRFIAEACRRNLQFFACRLPGSDIEMGATLNDTLPDGILPGFAIAPFHKKPPHTIRADVTTSDALERLFMAKRCINEPPMPKASTRREDHIARVARVRDIHRTLHGKTVLSTVITGRTTATPEAIFQALCETYDDAFCFIFRADGAGLWIGASPEVLLARRSGHVSSMALAGTLPAGAADWDEKNREEQLMVARFVEKSLRSHCDNVTCLGTRTLRAGKVAHLCTEYQASLPSDFASLAASLSPTPALCGVPYEESVCLIDDLEDHDRGFYGGYVGLTTNASDTDLYVNLRSMRLDPDGRFAVFAGGGVTELSKPGEEWEETRRKAYTMLSIIEKTEL